MMWLDTKEEVDFDWFMDILWNNELQLVSRDLTEEDWTEISQQLAEGRVIAKQRALEREKLAKEKEAVLA